MRFGLRCLTAYAVRGPSQCSNETKTADGAPRTVYAHAAPFPPLGRFLLHKIPHHPSNDEHKTLILHASCRCFDDSDLIGRLVRTESP